MSVREWFRIIETIKNYIPYIKNGGERRKKYDLVLRVLVNNIPQSWTGVFYRLGVENMAWKEAQELLIYL